MNKNNLQKIHELINESDLSEYGIYTILRTLKLTELISETMYEQLVKAAENDMLRIWRAIYLKKSLKYEKTTEFVEARILEYYRNTEHLTADQADEVLEHIRILASSLTMQTLQNRGKVCSIPFTIEKSNSEKNKYVWIPVTVAVVIIIWLIAVYMKGKTYGENCH